MAIGFTNARLVAIAILVIVCVLPFGGNNFMAYGQSCEGDVSGLISECSQYVMKEGKRTPPSPKCCAVAKKADIPCLCKYVTKDIEQYVSVEKAVYVAKYCGVPLKHGSKCGSYTIPRA